MKSYFKLYLLSFFILAVSFAACRKSNNSKYYYNPLNDTISPIIKISVPTPGFQYNFMDDVHIVGTVTDYETVARGGKLATLSIKVDELNMIDNSFKKNILTSTPDVDNKGGFSFNEKFMMVSNDANPTLCRLTVEAMDYINKFKRDTVYFYIKQ